jgi:osmotically-inducible protein OsmY
MKNDSKIQSDVIAELKWTPELSPSDIGVFVKDGVVTLNGMVDSYFKKIAAENAVKKVAGVQAVAEEIKVGISPYYRRTDTELAQAVVNALKWHSSIDEEKIKVKVENSIVTLEGEVEWDYQRRAAKTAIQNLYGIIGVNNLITLKSVAAPADIKKQIRENFHRSATIDAEGVSIDIVGSKATLRGNVHSLKEKEDAASAAWSARGIFQVDNQLQVKPKEEFAF